MSQRRLSIFGSTGSIGTSTLALVDAAPERFAIECLVAGGNHSLLAEQALKYRPRVVGLRDETGLAALQTALAGSGIELVSGQRDCDALARIPVDIVIAGITGLAGLGSVMAAVEAGQTLALANKESMVSAGRIVMQAARENGARILPLDSEHNAIFQCWAGWQSHHPELRMPTSDGLQEISHVCLTASGGPFRTMALADFPAITPAQAVKHPNWSMGQKISVDSATMMNKGLEVIEAAWLFGLESDAIEVLVHPQVAIHGLVYFRDGSVIGQMGTTDMKTPISYALEWPNRLIWDPEPLDLVALGRLDFFAVDDSRYPCFALARQALKTGGVMPAVLNAANEVAVTAFLAGRISFTAISALVNDVMQRGPVGSDASLDEVMAVDEATRMIAGEFVENLAEKYTE
jgi:1-deoxy-D-xylulose-5-phosphate reductoisomerase